MPTRRDLLTTIPAAALAAQAPAVRLGTCIGPLSANRWTPYQYLDYLAKLGLKGGQFPPATLGVDPLAPDPAELRRIRAYAAKLDIAMSLSGGSICPTSSGFNARLGTPEEQIARGLDISKIFGAAAMRVVIGGANERPDIDRHLATTARVLKAARSRIRESGIRIALENHGGDLQAREIKALVEDVGDDILGVCLDSGNPLWMLEDPHLTLELLAPYAVDSHVRDSAVWRVPEGVAVCWVNVGEGNVGIDQWVRDFVRRKPGVPVMLENIISTGPKIVKVFDPETMRQYARMPAPDLARYLALAEKGKPFTPAPMPAGRTRGQQQCADLEVSVRYMKRLLAA